MKKITVIIILFGIISCNTPSGQKIEDAYTVQQLEMPAGLLSQSGGIDFMPDGRLVACFMRGEVMTFNPKSNEWKLFAKGLLYPAPEKLR